MAPFNDQMADLMDIDGKLQDFLPEVAFEEDASSVTNGSRSKWSPPGELLHSYSSDGKKYQIWYAGLADPRAKEIISNMRVFIPFFIEGGTVDFLDEPDWAIERWKIFLL
jgi:histone acetyltransferase 1